MDAPDPLDLIDIDALLSDEERQIRGLAREWVADRILPDVDEWYEHGEFPAREAPAHLAVDGHRQARQADEPGQRRAPAGPGLPQPDAQQR